MLTFHTISEFFRWMQVCERIVVGVHVEILIILGSGWMRGIRTNQIFTLPPTTIPTPTHSLNLSLIF
jgi:hypothetical protein